MAKFNETTSSTDGFPSNVHVSSHPLVQAKLSALRKAKELDSSYEVKSLVDAIGGIVATEALAVALSTKPGPEAITPIGHTYTTVSVESPIALVPILRSGLGMLPAIESLLYPSTFEVHHLGMYRDSASGRPIEYYNNFTQRPEGSEAPVAIIVDPIIATGQTMCAAIDTVIEWGAKKVVVISVLGSDFGLRKVAAKAGDGIEINLWVGGRDDRTDERGMIVPGLGDVGDRMFGTVGK